MAVFLTFHQYFHQDLLSLWASIIPFGALIFGLLGSLGFRFGARLANYQADARLLGWMMPMVLIAMLLIYLIGYETSYVYGEIPAKSVDGARWILYALASGKVQIAHQESQLDIGKFGIILMLGKFAGALAGAYGSHMQWGKEQFCKPCNQYYSKLKERSITFTSAQELSDFQARLPTDPGKRAQALATAVPPSRVWVSKDGTVCLRVKHLECSECRDSVLVEEVTMMVRSRPQGVPQLSQTQRWSNRPGRRTADIPVPTKTGFGRKAV